MAETGIKAGQDLFKVLDNGFVKLVEFMGGDQRAVDSARVSFGSVSKGEKEQLVIRARLLDPETGMALGSETETAENIYTLMEAVRSLAAKLSEY